MSVLLSLLSYICMGCSAMKIVVTFIMAFNFHTSSLDNLVVFTAEETEAEGSLELAKVLQMCVKRLKLEHQFYPQNPVLCS